MHKIKAVHVVSKSDLNEMNQYLGVPLDMMSVIHHGVNHDVFVAPNNKKEVQESVWKHFKLEKNNYFIHISEKNWARKNIPRLLDAFIEAKKSGLAQNLVLAGKVHPLIIKRVKKIPSVKILGFISEKHLVQLIQGSDGLILPSIHEGFGLPLVEAMACGVPCITSNIHSPPEVVGDSGILVDPYNVTEISDAMIKLGKDEKLRSELSQKALVRSKDFSWKINATSLLQLYEKSVPKTTSWNFQKNFEVSARRTLATVCELYPHKNQRLLESLLTFDYSKMADWALKDGLSDEKTKDFLLPLESWLRNKSENKVWK
jgi:glycosyltransferase involved in cell wall biosynthesis